MQRNKLLIWQEFPVIGQKGCNPAQRPTFLQSTVRVKQPAASSWGFRDWTMRPAGRMESLSSLVLLILRANVHTDRTLINQSSTRTSRSTCRHVPPPEQENVAHRMPSVIVLAWHLRCHFSAALFCSHKTPWWKCAKHVYPPQLYFDLLSTYVSQEVSFGAEVMYGGVSIRISSWLDSRATVCLPLWACTHTQRRAPPLEGDCTQEWQIRAEWCGSKRLFLCVGVFASGGVWMHSSLGATLCVAVSGRALSGRSSQLRIMGKKTPFV